MKATELFYHFTAIWGHKWVSNMQDDNVNEIALRHWQQILDELTSEQINKACSKARSTLDWPPSIAQFKKMALGLMSVTEAFEDAQCGGTYRGLLDSWTWRTDTESNLQKKFYAKYDLLLQDLLCRDNNDQDLLEDMRLDRI